MLSLAVLGLISAAYMSTFGLDANQLEVKKSLRLIGIILCGKAIFFPQDWVVLPFALLCLVSSHPKVNLRKFARRVDKSLSDDSDHPARHVP